MSLNARRRPLVTDGAAKVDQLGGKINLLNNQNSGGLQVGEPIRADLIGSDQCRAAGITAHGASPILALCRELVAATVDPNRPLHAYRGDVLCLVIRSIGEAAHLDVNSKGSGFTKCRVPVPTAPPMRLDLPGDHICPTTSRTRIVPCKRHQERGGGSQ
jgi:hypothetical protein